MILTGDLHKDSVKGSVTCRQIDGVNCVIHNLKHQERVKRNFFLKKILKKILKKVPVFVRMRDEAFW